MAAKAVAEEGERIVDMAAALKAQEYDYFLGGERIGFVFPVYCYTLPDLVFNFVKNLKIDKSDYVFSIVTCGGGIGGTNVFLAKELSRKGIRLDYAVSLLMPDNAIFYYDIKPRDETDACLDRAKESLALIKAELNALCKKTAKGFSSKCLRPMYHLLAKTKKFWVTDACVGCGLCAARCPDEVIQMRNGIPVWTKDRCDKCSACINRCPKAAIQYGKATKGRLRYVNPSEKEN